MGSRARGPSRAALVGTIALGVLVTASAARAQDVPPEVVAAIGGPEVFSVLTQQDLAWLAEACPQEDVGPFVACLRSDPAAQRVIAAARARAGVEPPAEAAPADPEVAPGAVAPVGEPAAPVGDVQLPAEAIEAMPAMFRRFFVASDYAAMAQACPQEAPAELAACLDSGDLLPGLFRRRVMASTLDQMDVELAPRLTADELDAISAACSDAGGRWAECAWNKPPDDQTCDELERTLATCIVGQDRVGDLYQDVQTERKAAFGPELYVQYRGLLALIPMATVAQLRQVCPQTDPAALETCLGETELVSTIVQRFTVVAATIVRGAAEQLAGAGAPMSEPQAEQYTAKLLGLLFTFPIHVVASLATGCEASLGRTVASTADIDAHFACIAQSAQTDPIANPAYISKAMLASWLAQAREKVVAKVLAREIANQERAFDAAMVVMLAFAGLGFVVILLLPVILRERLEASGGSGFKASAVAGAVFAATVGALTVTMLLIRVVQGSVAVEYTSPKLRVVEAAFDVLERDDYVEGFSSLSRQHLDFVKSPLRSVLRESDATGSEQAGITNQLADHWSRLLEEPELTRIAHNAAALAEHAESYRSVFGIFRHASGLLAIFPVLLGILAALLYLLPMRATLVDIATSPLRTGDDGAATSPWETVKAELKLVGPFLGVIVVALPLTGLFIALAVTPLMELLIGHGLLSIFYLVFAPASVGALYGSVGALILLLVLILAVYLLATASVVGGIRKVLYARFHLGEPLENHRGFFVRGLPAALWVMTLPVLVAFAALIVMGAVVEPGLDVLALTTSDLVALPIATLLAFPLVFWLGRGFRALRAIKAYDASPASEASGAGAA